MSDKLADDLTAYMSDELAARVRGEGKRPPIEELADRLKQGIADNIGASTDNVTVHVLPDGYVSVSMSHGAGMELEPAALYAGDVGSLAELVAGDIAEELYQHAGGARREAKGRRPDDERLHDVLDALVEVEYGDLGCAAEDDELKAHGRRVLMEVVSRAFEPLEGGDE